MKSTLRNLLIIEDNPFIGKELVIVAEKISSIKAVRLTASLKEAISILDNNNYELIILDLKLPDGDGIELLSWLKEKQIKTKVFVFSTSKELKRSCLKYGAFAFYDKAKDFDTLIEALKKESL